MTIDGCLKCEEFKKSLLSKNIKFQEFVCSDTNNNEICDRYESITHCEIYPMILIDESTFIVLTHDYNKLGKIHVIGKYNVVYCHSINNMLDILQELVY